MHNKVVLLVDDDRDALDIFGAILQYGGYVVISTNDPNKVIPMAISSKPDLVLMDLHIPGMDGYELATQLCSHEKTASIPIIAVSADVLPAAKQRALEAGCKQLVTKPVEPKKLLATVNAILEGSKAAVTTANYSSSDAVPPVCRPAGFPRVRD